MSVFVKPSLVLAGKMILTGSEFVRLPISGRRSTHSILLLKIEGWSSRRGAGPTLYLTHRDDTRSTFHLVANESGRIVAFLDTGGQAVKAAYISGLDGEAVGLERLRLRALSGPSFILRAMRLQPKQTLLALHAAVTGKRLRASNRLKRIVHAQRSADETAWLQRRQPDWDTEVIGIAEKLTRQTLPRITVVWPVPFGSGANYPSESSLEAPPYPAWDLCLTGDTVDLDAGMETAGAGNGPPQKIHHAPSIKHALERATGDWVLVLREGDRLAAGSLWRIAQMALAAPEAAVLYGDHTVRDSIIGRRMPALAPVWNLPYYAACDYIGAAAFNRRALSTDVLERACAGNHAPDYILDRLILIFATTLGSHRVQRTPRFLTHQCAVRSGARSQHQYTLKRLSALDDVFPRSIGTLALDQRGNCRIRYARPEGSPPLVSLIVPTRDRPDLLEPCIDGLLHRTDYPSIEILVADNGSTDRRALAYLEGIAADPRVRVIHVPGPFNFSAINNLAARAARGKLLGFVNNDIEVLDADWLWEMAAPALQRDIGAVGAKLLYPSGLVQHAGVILGLNGLAGHAHRFFSKYHPGYMMRLGVTHYLSAVTAACLVVSKEKFFQVGGFDERRFPVALNDVDLCLKLRERGYQTLFTPYATLLHKESASRESDTSRNRRADYNRECAHFRSKWSQYIDDDPFYHPELSRSREDFTLNDSV